MLIPKTLNLELNDISIINIYDKPSYPDQLIRLEYKVTDIRKFRSKFNHNTSKAPLCGTLKCYFDNSIHCNDITKIYPKGCRGYNSPEGRIVSCYIEMLSIYLIMKLRYEKIQKKMDNI